MLIDKYYENLRLLRAMESSISESYSEDSSESPKSVLEKIVEGKDEVDLLKEESVEDVKDEAKTYYEENYEDEVNQKIEELKGRIPNDWSPNENVKRFYERSEGKISEAHIDSSDLLSMFFDVDKNYVNKARAASNPFLYFSTHTLEKAYPAVYNAFISTTVSTVLSVVPDEYSAAYFDSFMNRVGGAKGLSEKLIQIGTEKGYNKTFYYGQGESIDLSDSAIESARISLLGAMTGALKDVTLWGLGISDKPRGIISESGFPIDKEYRISSNFGNRFHPIYEENRNHNGIDIAARIGTPIYPIMAGRVVSVGEGKSNGKYLYIKHSGGYESRYLHCSEIHVSRSEKVDRGDLIAEVGDTGDATGPHLHLEILKDGIHINPSDFFAENGINF